MVHLSLVPLARSFRHRCMARKTARELPYASTLCGACADVCPVKIPIPTILRHLRRRVAEGDEIALPTIRCPSVRLLDLASLALAQNWIYRFGARLLPIIIRSFAKLIGYQTCPIH